MGVGHLGLGQTQMSGGFTVFSNYTADHVFGFRGVGLGGYRNGKASKGARVLAGQRAEGTRRSGSAGVRMWCVGVCKFVWGSEEQGREDTDKKSEGWGSGPIRVGGWVWSVVRRCGVGCEEVAWCGDRGGSGGTSWFCVVHFSFSLLHFYFIYFITLFLFISLSFRFDFGLILFGQ